MRVSRKMLVLSVVALGLVAIPLAAAAPAWNSFGAQRGDLLRTQDQQKLQTDYCENAPLGVCDAVDAGDRLQTRDRLRTQDQQCTQDCVEFEDCNATATQTRNQFCEEAEQCQQTQATPQDLCCEQYSYQRQCRQRSTAP